MAKTSKKKDENIKKKGDNLAKRREQKKISMRKAREKLNNNPEKRKEYLKKRRQDYQKLKQDGKIKSIDKFSPREQRAIRKEWKDRSKKCRERKKIMIEGEKAAASFTPPESPVLMPNENNEAIIPKIKSRQKESGEKLARKNREMKSKEIDFLRKKLKEYKKRTTKYKVKVTPLKKINQELKQRSYSTPQKVVHELEKKQNLSQEIKKKLLFGEVLRKQVKENYKDSDAKRKAKFVACLTGKVVKKYKLIECMRALTSRRSIKKSGYLETRRINFHINTLRQSVEAFLERDDNSRMTAGKKETTTKGKKKKQKRFLNDSLMNLHRKYLRENPKCVYLSYSLFCKLRPFWILIPKVDSRDTCLCKTHANFGFLISTMKKCNVINEKNPTEILKALCCPAETLQEKCLLRECNECCEKKIDLIPFDEKINTTYEKWVTKKVPITIKGEEKLSQKTVKVTVESNYKNLVSEMDKMVVPYMRHVCNIKHQYTTVQDIKGSLTEYEALLHFDYSQNYACKYASEIQSFHFGGSRTQITLHTSVLYYSSKNTNHHKSFCTVSESLRHDPAAVCAHLNPVVGQIQEIVPKLKKVHFLSDGPSTQYKNKTMFYLFGSYLTKKLGVDEAVWHYSEAGHGKGAADGIGGSVKRLADSLVSRGLDIANFQQFEAALKEHCKETSIFSVTSKDIHMIDTLLPTQPLETFPGTMRIHQLTWDKEKPSVIQTRSLSCLKCSSSKPCLHYNLGEIKYPKQQEQETQSFSVKPKVKKLKVSEVYSSDDSEEDGIPENTEQTEHPDIIYKENDYVVVKLDGKRKSLFFIGHILTCENEEFSIKFMKKISNNKFMFDDEKVYTVDKMDIVGKLKQPLINNREHRIFNDIQNFSNISIS